jgi:hypothetical protein
MIRDRATVLAIWIAASLLAIAILGDLPYLGIAVAICGGVVVGITHLLAFDRQGKKEAESEKEARGSRKDS